MRELKEAEVSKRVIPPKRKKAYLKHPVFGNPVYCNYCGHFLGYENVKKGAVAFYCRYCKDFVRVILEEDGNTFENKT